MALNLMIINITRSTNNIHPQHFGARPILKSLTLPKSLEIVSPQIDGENVESAAGTTRYPTFFIPIRRPCG